jgi:hypothetical protein
MFGTLLVLSLQQPPGPCYPTTPLGRFPFVEQDESHPEEASHRTSILPTVEMELMGSLQCLVALVDPTQEIRSGRQELEIVGSER